MSTDNMSEPKEYKPEEIGHMIPIETKENGQWVKWDSFAVVRDMAWRVLRKNETLKDENARLKAENERLRSRTIPLTVADAELELKMNEVRKLREENERLKDEVEKLQNLIDFYEGRGKQ